jgi:hypothetical protein
LIVVALHSGFQAEELCKLTEASSREAGQEKQPPESVRQTGQVPRGALKVTVREALAERMEELPGGVISSWLCRAQGQESQ